MKQYSMVRHGYEYFVRIHSPEHAETFTKVVHAAPGQSGQAAQDAQEFVGAHAEGRAMVAWMRAARLVAA